MVYGKNKKNSATKSLTKLQKQEKISAVIARVLDLEPLGVLRLSRLKNTPQFDSSANAVGPQPGSVHEFGAGLSKSQISTLLKVVAADIGYNLFKLEIFKEAYRFEDLQNGWMIRLMHGLNKYPKYFCAYNIPLFDGREEAEIIFFANSMENAYKLQTRFNAALGEKSLRDVVEDALHSISGTLADKLFGEDEDIQKFFDQYYSLMIGKYFPNETDPTSKVISKAAGSQKSPVKGWLKEWLDSKEAPMT